MQKIQAKMQKWQGRVGKQFASKERKRLAIKLLYSATLNTFNLTSVSALIFVI